MDVQRFTLKWVALCVLLLGIGASARPLYSYAYDYGWFEDAVLEEEIERIEAALEGGELPEWAGKFASSRGGGRQFWLGPDGNAATFMGGHCSAPYDSDEGLGTVAFRRGKLRLHFPMTRRSWPRGRKLQYEFVVGRFGQDVFLVEERNLIALRKAHRIGAHPVWDAEVYLLPRTSAKLSFDQPLEFLGEDGWE